MLGHKTVTSNARQTERTSRRKRVVVLQLANDRRWLEAIVICCIGHCWRFLSKHNFRHLLVLVTYSTMSSWVSKISLQVHVLRHSRKPQWLGTAPHQDTCIFSNRWNNNSISSESCSRWRSRLFQMCNSRCVQMCDLLIFFENSANVSLRTISHCREYSRKYLSQWREWNPRREIVYASFFCCCTYYSLVRRPFNLVSATCLSQHLCFPAYLISCAQIARTTNCQISTIRTIISKFLSK